MSSALQVLVHIPEIANYFLEGKFREDKRKLKIGCDISEEYYSVATYIWKGYNSTYKPDSFKANVQQYIDILDTSTQQDSAEFLAQLLELMHNELTG